VGAVLSRSYIRWTRETCRGESYDLASATHRLIETLDAHERAVEALEALEAIARQRPAPTDSESPW